MHNHSSCGETRIPSLSGVVLATGILPINFRKFGQPAAALLIITIGSFMFWRAWPHPPDAPPGACPMCEPTITDSP